MRKIFANILELPIQLLNDEPVHKFQGTYMVVNDELRFISSISDGNRHMQVKDETEFSYYFTEPQKVSLTPWLPPCGLFTIKDGLAFLSKNPKKQWKKSFNTSLYSVEWIVLPTEDIGKWNYPFYLFKEKISMIKEHENILYLMNERIAKKQNGKWEVINENFKQEVLEYEQNIQ